MKKAIPILLVAVLVLIVGAGSWQWIQILHTQQRQASQRLVEAQGALAEREQALTVLEEERRKLSDSYDALKERWTKAEQQLQNVTQESSKMTTEMAALSQERADLKRTLERTTGQVTETQRQSHELQQRVATLQQEIDEEATQKQALETAFREATQHLLTRAELEQVAQAFAQQRGKEKQLSQRTEELTGAYEQLVADQDRPALLAPPTPPPPVGVIMPLRAQEPRPQRPIRLSEAVTTAGELPHTERRLNDQELARLYRTRGEAHLATHQYPKAAAAFEQSLVLEDDPSVHVKLAFIYSRFLHDAEKAQRHTLKTPSADPSVTALGGFARANGLPRKSRKLVWQWLTQ